MNSIHFFDLTPKPQKTGEDCAQIFSAFFVSFEFALIRASFRFVLYPLFFMTSACSVAWRLGSRVFRGVGFLFALIRVNSRLNGSHLRPSAKSAANLVVAPPRRVAVVDFELA